jgi:hypothetical protein
MKSGIYSITNLKNGKVYIGYAKNIRIRWNHHRSALRLGKHPNKHLQDSWNRHGESSFEFKVVELCTEELLCRREDDWCKLLQTHKKGYNMRLTDPSKATGAASTETIEKIRKALTGRKSSKSAVDNLRKSIGRAVVVLTSDEGKYVAEFETISDAESYTGVGKGNIFSIMTKKGKKSHKSGNGYTFVYRDEYDPKKDYTVRRLTGKYLQKPIWMCDPVTCKKLKRFNSVSEATEYLKSLGNAVHSGISQALSNPTKTYKNHKWKYHEFK